MDLSSEVTWVLNVPQQLDPKEHGPSMVAFERTKMSGDAKKRTVSKQALKVLINPPDIYIPFNIKSQLTRLSYTPSIK